MGTPLESGDFCAIHLSSVKVLADRHRGATYRITSTGNILFSAVNTSNLE